MIFITPSSNATQAKDYYTRALAVSDYYTKDMAEMPGQWHGLGSELLGLKGEVKQKDFFALCDNIDPNTGKSLTRNTLANRKCLYDLTFDVPKAVSLAYEVGGDDRILDAFQSSVNETMGEIEGAMMARVRSGREKNADENRSTGNMVWAGFTHRTSRPVDGVPDPQLHMHAVILNATYDTEENKWKAGQFGNIVRDKGYYQAAFHSRLGEKLSALGYGVERDGNSFKLVGIDKSLADKFSRRSGIIEAAAERLGVKTEKAKGELGRRTREQKSESSLSMPELRELWQSRLTDEERNAIASAHDGKQTTSPDAARAVDYALEHSFERASAVPERDLLKTALIHSVGKASVSEIHREMNRDNVISRDHKGIRYATTKEVFQEELAMSAFVRDGRGKYRKLGGTIAPELDPSLSQEQRDAELVVLGSHDRVTSIKGGAGTGKTRMMTDSVKNIKRGGLETFLFAPSAEASRGVLRSEGFENAETVERLLTDPKMQKAVNGQVIWVDEAGLLSVKDMKRLFDVAEAQNARVVLSGDTNQHTAVYRGDALRILEKDAGMKTGELKQIRRQTDATYREAVKAISEGDRPDKDGRTRLEAGVEMLDSMGAIIESNGEGRYRQIATDYAKATLEKKANGSLKSALVVSPTHREADRVTDAIRNELKSEGRLDGKERSFTSLRALTLTEAQRKDRREYAAGMVVQFHQNAKGGFKRGDRYAVSGVDQNGVHAKGVDGSAVILPLQDAKHFQIYQPEQVAFAKGDRLRITKNGFAKNARRGVLGLGKDRLNNGSVYEVDGFTRQGDIKLSNGFVLPKDYGGMAHGYVVTSHASQGKTVDKVLIAVGQESFAAANKEQFYVSVSRGREAVRLYTDDKAAMLDAVRGSAARLSASELMADAGVKPKPREDGLRKLFKVQQIKKAYRAVRERVAMPWNHHAQREVPHHGGISR